MASHARFKRLSGSVSAASAAAIFVGSLYAAPAKAAVSAEASSFGTRTTKNSDVSPAVTDRFVVKFSGATKTSPVERDKSYDKVEQESGIPVDEVRTTASGAQVITTDKPLSQTEATKLLSNFNDEMHVVSAEPDLIAYPATLTPIDELYPEQWHLQYDEPSGLRISNAWDRSTGAGQVVAVIDSGITKHSDLDAAVLPGYDMITDTTRSRDGDGRDSNPQDEGDWRNYQQCTDSTQTPSSWHGTVVAGAIAATANTQGVIGAAPDVKIVPVRALGACGGYMSDISDSIIWASGAPVAGVPNNANPAKIINLSLTGGGACLSYVQSAIDTAVSRGSSVFVAAGNTRSSTYSATPANCNSVIAVAASSQDGYLASYSNYGPEVDITAPGGDGTRPSGYKKGIMTTFNSGTSVPGAESYAAKMGTSLATPLAASVGALMLAADPTLTPAGLETRMKATARSMPGGCSATSCGAGLLDAAAALGNPVFETVAGTPAINGTGKLGTTLTVNPGTWNPSGTTFTYQWKRYGQPIDGETADTFTIPDNIFQSPITVDVTGRKPGYTTVTKISAPVTVIQGDFTVPKPTISGTVVGDNLVNAEIGSWSPDPTNVAYQWNLDGTPVPDATWSSYYLAAGDAGKKLTVSVTGSRYPYNTLTVTSDPVTVGVPAIVPDSVTISGTPTVGNYLQATTGWWTPAPVTMSYQWTRDRIDIAGATSEVYLLTGADAGKVISVAVTGTKENYPATTAAASTAVVAPGIITSTQPTISGPAEVAGILTANASFWGPDPISYTYQWKRDGAAITGATSKTYLVSPNDGTKQITVAVTGTKTGYTPVTVMSEAVTVGKGNLSTGTATISGLGSVGNLLTAKTERWLPTPIDFAYQWKRNGANIPGATSSTYRLAPADVGTNLTFAVTGSKTNYNSTTVVSPATDIIQLGVLSSNDPAISGTAKVGSVLTASLGAWGPAPVTLSYQWKRAGVNIPGATSTTYTLTGADAGKNITVDVHGNKEGYQTGTVTSVATAPVAMGTLTTAPVTVTGATKVGSTLAATTGAWGPAPVTLTYQWKRAGVNIIGADKGTYALVGADAGRQISVTVTGTKAGYTTVSAASPVTAAVAGGTLTAALPIVTGTSKVGYALAAKPGVWTAGTVLSYQWYRSGVAITGAKSATCTLGAADLGKRITVRVTGTKTGYTSAYRDSAATAAVVAGTLVKSAPKITGTLRSGYVLITNPGTWTSGTVFYYQWYRSGVAIKGATAKTYKLSATDRADTIKVRVTGVKAGYTSAAVFSLSTARVP
jgi:hypothetical protein